MDKIDPQKIVHTLKNEVQFVIMDHDGVISYANDRYCSMTGYMKFELVGQKYWLFMKESHENAEELWQTVSEGHTWREEVKSERKDGTPFWKSVMIIPYLNEQETSNQHLAISIESQQLTEVEQTLEAALKDSFQETIKHLENTIFKYVQTEDGRLVFTLSEGKIAEEIGFVTEAIAGSEVKEFFPEDVQSLMEDNFRIAAEGKSNHFEMRLFGTDFLVYLSPIIVDEVVIEVVGTAFDITDKKEAEELIHHMAYHDYLTGLLNRAAFHDELDRLIDDAKEKDERFALLFIDLDRFKNINDTLGHRMGDQVLIAVANRLEESVCEQAIIARLGGDECAILLPNQSKETTRDMAEHIVSQFSRPLLVDQNEIYITPSVGISLYPKDGREGEDLLNNADQAMYHVKNNENKNICFFSEELQDELKLRNSLENDLRTALENDEFILYYQPQMDIATKKVFGVESLIRWQHPDKGMISPGEFIPIAEKSGLIIPMGEWVLREASEQNKRWQDEGYEPIVISVNVSPQQFMQTDFVTVVKTILQQTNLAPHYLELEITEGMTMDVKSTTKVLKSLRDLGVKVSIDDFGTGYSSLNYLSKLPINQLKIDQSFIQEMNEKNRAIVKTIISLANNLQIDLIAEGVEMKEQVNFLKDQNCNKVQGFFFSRPLPAKEVTQFFRKQPTVHTEV